MRTFLRDRRTGRFFQGVSDWTTRLEQAFNFQSPERAVRFVRLAKLNWRDMEIVFAFANQAHNLSLPLDERFGFNAPVAKSAPIPDNRVLPPSALAVQGSASVSVRAPG